jgi:hypothetical protein
VSDDVKAALAKIEGLIEDVVALPMDQRRPSLAHWRWVLDVLRGDREVLERHGGCHMNEPCPDAARVLRRYLSERP